jgi:hypothetical protein
MMHLSPVFIALVVIAWQMDRDSRKRDEREKRNEEREREREKREWERGGWHYTDARPEEWIKEHRAKLGKRIV